MSVTTPDVGKKSTGLANDRAMTMFPEASTSNEHPFPEAFPYASTHAKSPFVSSLLKYMSDHPAVVRLYTLAPGSTSSMLSNTPKI